MGALIAGLTFIAMLFYGADFISALLTAIFIIAVISGGVWLNEKAENNTASFGFWYALVSMVAIAIVAIVFFTQ